MVTPKTEDAVGGGLEGRGDAVIGHDPGDEFIAGRGLFHLQVVLNDMHQLRVDLHGAAEQVQVIFGTFGIVKVPGIAGMVRTEACVAVVAHLGARHKVVVLADIIGAAHADETAFTQILRTFIAQTKDLDQGRQVVGIATDHLQVFVVAHFEHFVIDAAGVLPAESKFAALGNEQVGGVFVIFVPPLLHRVATRRAIDDHAGHLEGLFGGVLNLQTHFLEAFDPVRVRHQTGATAQQVLDLGAVSQ